MGQDGDIDNTVYAVDKLMSEARRLAADYRRTTGQSLGLSAEIARHDACTLLGLKPEQGQSGAGFDAIGQGTRAGKRIQIKGRAIFDESKRSPRIGQLKMEREWDSVVLVLMNADFETDAMYEADKQDIIDAMAEQDKGQRNKRGAMSVARFKNVARLVWTREEGAIDDELWDNQTGL